MDRDSKTLLILISLFILINTRTVFATTGGLSVNFDQEEATVRISGNKPIKNIQLYYNHPVKNNWHTRVCDGHTQCQYTWSIASITDGEHAIMGKVHFSDGTKEFIGKNGLADTTPIILEVSNERITQRSSSAPCGSSDVKKDGKVDIFDLVLVGQYYEKTSNVGIGTAGPSPDINNDNTVDVFDLVCVANHFGEKAEVPETGKNQKNMNKYSNKEAFLVSDQNWEDILSLVPVTTWTNEHGLIKSYPTLIYHQETEGYDTDSILHFLEQYNAQKLTAINGLPEDLVGWLKSQGLEPTIISPNIYLNYWQSFDTIVYVKNDYKSALLASTYASLHNAPLIIQDSTLHRQALEQELFKDKTVIGIGACPTGINCQEQYTFKELQNRYIQETNTDKILLVNPNDLNIKLTEEFTPERLKGTGRTINKLYTKLSLTAPFLSAAKHEIIFTTSSNRFEEVDNRLENQISEHGLNPTYLTIIASPDAIEMGNSDEQRELDNSVYGNLDQDVFVEIAVGRIFGITSSDVSSYIARAIFYGELNRPDIFGMFVTDSTIPDAPRAKANDRFLTRLGYNKESIYTNTGKRFTESDLPNKFYMTYSGHGKTDSVGQSSPLLSSSNVRQYPLSPNIFFTDACLTCAYDEANKKGDLLCTNLLRQGTLGNIASVFITTSYAPPSRTILEQMGRDNSIGQAFKSAINQRYVAHTHRHCLHQLGGPRPILVFPFDGKCPLENIRKTEDTYILLGDPTINLNLAYPYSSSETVETQTENLSLGWIDLNHYGISQVFYVPKNTDVSRIEVYLKDRETGRQRSGDIRVQILNKDKEMVHNAVGYLPFVDEHWNPNLPLYGDWKVIGLSDTITLEPGRYYLKLTTGEATWTTTGTGEKILESFEPSNKIVYWGSVQTPPPHAEFHNFLFKINENLKFDIHDPSNYKLAVLDIPETEKNIEYEYEQSGLNVFMYEAYPGKEVAHFFKHTNNAGAVLKGFSSSYINNAVYVWPIDIPGIEDIAQVEYLSPTKKIFPPTKKIFFPWKIEDTPYHKISVIQTQDYSQGIQIRIFENDGYFLSLQELEERINKADWPSDTIPSYKYKIYIRTGETT